jgi:DNA-binding transcriptional ArsR family regulator
MQTSVNLTPLGTSSKDGNGGAQVAHPLPNELVELIAERFKVLSEPTRVKLLDRLRDGEATVVELTGLVGTTEQNVSKHLGVLLRAGVVGRRKEGNFSYYSIADEGVFALCEDVCGGLQRRLEALHRIVRDADVRPQMLRC